VSQQSKAIQQEREVISKSVMTLADMGFSNGHATGINYQDILFSANSAEISQDGQETLDLVAYDSKRFDDCELSGHASQDGEESPNMDLSQDRSAAVYNYIKVKTNGLKLSRKDYGETRLLYLGWAERHLNRRVEISCHGWAE
jgi:outer membrane protein OmpA-like peptidoglycan-associated protein